MINNYELDPKGMITGWLVSARMVECNCSSDGASVVARDVSRHRRILLVQQL